MLSFNKGVNRSIIKFKQTTVSISGSEVLFLNSIFLKFEQIHNLLLIR